MKPEAQSTIIRKLIFLPFGKVFWARSVDNQSIGLRFFILMLRPEDLAWDFEGLNSAHNLQLSIWAFISFQMEGHV